MFFVCNECAVSQGTIRGNFGWESSLRQKPKTRTVFQAGDNTWSKPVGLDKDSKNELGSQDDVVGVLEYTTKIPLGHKLLEFKSEPKKKQTNFELPDFKISKVIKHQTLVDKNIYLSKSEII